MTQHRRLSWIALSLLLVIATASPSLGYSQVHAANLPQGSSSAATSSVSTAAGLAATPTRLSFAPGSTSVTVSGHLATYGQGTYILRASANQVMEVQVDSAVQVLLDIWGADGEPLKHGAVGGPMWRGILPATQDYYIGLSTPDGSAADYTLSVSIPVRIQFAAGGTSATVRGRVAAYGSMMYVFRALAGQTLSLALVTVSDNVLLEVYGFDGTVLKRTVTGTKTWTGTLPATQDYIIRVVSFGDAASFTLTVSIPPLKPSDKPVRIAFAPGGTSATRTGHLAPGGVDRYILRASKGQILDVLLESPAGAAELEITGANGIVLLSTDSASPGGYRNYLPKTQDYILKVMSPGGATDYTLIVTIPARIRFAPGATSATVRGHVAAYGYVRYVLKASAGQTMSLTLDVASDNVLPEVFGFDGTVLKRTVTGAKTWTGTLPFTEDYFVTVVSFGSAASYALHVTIK